MSTLSPALNSPIFPSDSFTSESTINSPENQITSMGGVSISVVLAEPVLFLQGFTANEYDDQAPALLRGSLVITTTKPTKIKAITLTFKGQSRTDWPEGIPPKRVEMAEQKDIHCHVWSFFNATFAMAEYSSGAHLVRFSKDGHSRTASSSSCSPPPSDTLLVPEPASPRGRSSPSLEPVSSYSSSTTSGIKGFASRFRRAASPNPSSSMASVQNLSGLSLGPHRSFSKKESHEQDAHTKGYRIFEPGEYIYNFELAIPQSLPETITANFGSVKYSLEALIERPGTFKPNLCGTREVLIVRAASDNNLEASEPIAISRDWEDQLHYDIVIGGKCFPIGTTIPIAFKFTPLAKMRCHRIRVYVTENIEYFCKNKKVHRIEPTKKFLLKEQLPSEGLSGSLLGEYAGADLNTCTEMEFDVGIPLSFVHLKERLHPNTAYENIQVHHWIKLVLRLSKMDPNDSAKRKYYEISIDSPISLLDNHCTNANLLLPQYIPRRQSLYANSVAMPIASSPDDRMRPIHFIRKPSIAPPPFDYEQPPPTIDAPSSRPSSPPPNYDTVMNISPMSLHSRESLSSDTASYFSGASLRTPSTSVSGESIGQGRVNRQVSVVSSVDIADQSIAPLEPIRTRGLNILPTSHELRPTPSSSSASSSIRSLQRSNGSNTHCNPYLPGEVYPLLDHHHSGFKDDLVPMDSSGDIGLTVANDFDDSTSLQSTPSLWIS
jgi:hypothetical protein